MSSNQNKHPQRKNSYVFHGASNRHRPFLYPAAITSALFPNRWIPPRLQLTAKDIIDALCT